MENSGSSPVESVPVVPSSQVETEALRSPVIVP